MRALVVLLLWTAVAHAQGSVSGHVDLALNGRPASVPDGGVWVFLVDVDHPQRRAAKDFKHQVSIQQVTGSNGKPTFVPHALVVPVGTNVDFPNNGNQVHNVFSPDPPFDLGRYGPKAPSGTHAFTVTELPPKALEQEIYCDIHQCMWARVKVVPVAGPNFIARVDDKSLDYRLTNIPPGKYQVWVWAVATKEQIADTILVRNGTDTKALTVKLQLGTRNPKHDNKAGQPYTNLYTGC